MSIRNDLRDCKNVGKWLLAYQGWFTQPAQPAKHMDVGYRSDDPAVVKRQLTHAKAVGIGGFTIDWYGNTPDYAAPTNAATLLLMKECELQNMEFSIMLDAGAWKWDSAEKPMVRLQKTLDYAKKTLMPSPAYSRITGKPVVWEFGWRGSGIDPSAVAKANPDLLIFLESSSVAGVPNTFSWINGFPPDKWQTHLSSFLARKDAIQVPHVFYGFDDSKAPWTKHRIIPGSWSNWAECLSMIKASNKQFPYGQIVTFNDYDEGSRVEPLIEAEVAAQSAAAAALVVMTGVAAQLTTEQSPITIAAAAQSLSDASVALKASLTTTLPLQRA